MGAVGSEMVLNCDHCKEEGVQVEAAGYCKDCADFLCISCFKIHLRPKPWRNHQLLNKDNMPGAKLEITESDMIDECTGIKEDIKLDTDVDVIEDDEERCVNHPEKTVEYYCEGHKVLGCSVCVTLDHRLCNITYLPNSLEVDDTEYTSLKTEMEKLKEELQSSLTKTEGFKNQVEDMAEKAVNDVVSFRNMLVMELEKSEKATLAQASKLKVKDMNYINGILKDFGLIETALKVTQADIEEKQQNKCPNRQMYLAMRNCSDAIQDYKQRLRILNEKNTGIVSYKFQPSDTLLKAFRTGIKKFGWFQIGNGVPVDKDNLSQVLKTITTMNAAVKNDNQRPSSNVKAEDKSNSTMNLVTAKVPNTMLAKTAVKTNGQHAAASNVLPGAKSNPTFELEKGSNSTASKSAVAAASHVKSVETSSLASESGQYIMEINVRLPSDKHTSAITGMAMMNGQKMAACDFKNCCIKIIDVNNRNTLSLSVRLNSAPYEVVFTGKELAITQPHMGTLAIFTDTDEFKSYRNLSVGAECRGIAYQAEKFFISFKTNPGKIKVQTVTGEVLRTFTTVGGDSFHHPCHLAVHPSLPTLYVSDWQITILGFDGNLVRKHRDIEFNELKGLSVSADGNVYVCDMKRNLVYLVQPMVALKQVFLDGKHGIRQPYSVLISGKKKKKMFVSMDNSDSIKVFQISKN